MCSLFNYSSHWHRTSSIQNSLTLAQGSTSWNRFPAHQCPPKPAPSWSLLPRRTPPYRPRSTFHPQLQLELPRPHCNNCNTPWVRARDPSKTPGLPPPLGLSAGHHHQHRHRPTFKLTVHGARSHRIAEGSPRKFHPGGPSNACALGRLRASLMHPGSAHRRSSLELPEALAIRDGAQRGNLERLSLFLSRHPSVIPPPSVFAPGSKARAPASCIVHHASGLRYLAAGVGTLARWHHGSYVQYALLQA